MSLLSPHRPVFEAKHARRLRVLDLEPGLAPARPIRARAVLADDALEPKPAGVGKDLISVAFDVFVELDADSSAP
jgi:hypothetical protein